MEKKRFYYCEQCKKRIELTEEEIKTKGIVCSINGCLKNRLVYLGNENSTEEMMKKQYQKFLASKPVDIIPNPDYDDLEDSKGKINKKQVKAAYSNFGE